VGKNLENLGAHPVFVGVVGEDEAGDWIRSHVPDNRGLVLDRKSQTCVKTRIIAHQQQVVRVDRENKKTLSPKLRQRIAGFIYRETCDGIIISDYNKGLIDKSLLSAVLPLCKKKNIPVFVDPKVENFSLFSPITLITPNHHEAEKIVHHPCETDAEVEKAGKKIMSKIQTKFLILKRGERGLSVLEKGKKTVHIPTRAKEVYDVTGAGDTVIATAALALLSGASITQAAVLANAAAGVVVAKIGTATLTPKELFTSLKH
jgi:D-beta-D-heptose 7-phosphate kinase/D-beta-D-heptose 1-phosphate adenosyltransferase